jgi:uncharacterized protein
MLLRFTVSNFLSFSEEVEFNMFPSNFKIHKSHVYHTQGGLDLLKATAIYGANGSGKSNFVEAISSFSDTIMNEETIWLTPPYFKLSKSYKDKPSMMEVEIKINNRYFIYGISFLEDYIVKEWLHESFITENRFEVIFERESNKIAPIISVIHDKYLKNEKTKMRFEIYGEDLQNDALFLNKVSNHIIEAELVIKWFNDSLTIIKPYTSYALTKRLHEDKDFLLHVNDVLKYMNLGMAKIGTKLINIKDFFGENDEDETQKRLIEKKLRKESSLLFEHDGEIYVALKQDRKIYIETLITYNQGENKELIEFSLQEQSDGTQRILDLIPIITLLEKEGAVIFIDEIDRSLHPVMIIKFLSFIMAHKTKGQLIFTTHESHLLDLDIFRQDEIWFTEKDEVGATKMYPLSDFKPRYDLDIQKGYLGGRFGAIPFLGELKNLIPADEI